MLDDLDALAALEIKLNLLHYGVMPTESALSNYGPPFLEKRCAYGNADDPAFAGRSLPQEAYLYYSCGSRNLL